MVAAQAEVCEPRDHRNEATHRDEQVRQCRARIRCLVQDVRLTQHVVQEAHLSVRLLVADGQDSKAAGLNLKSLDHLRERGQVVVEPAALESVLLLSHTYLLRLGKQTVEVGALEIERQWQSAVRRELVRIEEL